MIMVPYLHGRYSTVTGFAHIPPAVAGGRGFSWVLELRDFAEPDTPLQWPDPAPDVWCGPDAPRPLGLAGVDAECCDPGPYCDDLPGCVIRTQP